MDANNQQLEEVKENLNEISKTLDVESQRRREAFNSLERHKELLRAAELELEDMRRGGASIERKNFKQEQIEQMIADEEEKRNRLEAEVKEDIEAFERLEAERQEITAQEECLKEEEMKIEVTKENYNLQKNAFETSRDNVKPIFKEMYKELQALNVEIDALEEEQDRLRNKLRKPLLEEQRIKEAEEWNEQQRQKEEERMEKEKSGESW